MTSGPRLRARALTFGHVAKPMHQKIGELMRVVGRLAGLELRVRAFESYEALAKTLRAAHLDVAWLAPIPLISLACRGLAVPIAAMRTAPYESAIVVRASSTLRKPASLKGWRAAWVDRHSAAGFVVPRIQLASLGIDPRTAFSSERMFGTHEDVVRAVIAGAADFGATYAWRDEHGCVHGPWSTRELHDEVHVLATFGEIPSDAICVQPRVPDEHRAALSYAFEHITTSGAARALVLDIFGSVGFCTPDLASYERLRTSAYAAYKSGLLDLDTPDPLDVARTLELRKIA